MITPLPSKEQALEELTDLIAMLYVAFPEIARECVIPYFSTRGRRPNPRLFTDMCRYEVRELLLIRGIEVCDDNDADEIDLRELANNGIEILYRKQWGLKVLRSRNGEVPGPGDSKRRRAYYAQQIRLSQSRPNAVILWDFDPDYTDVSLRLALPREVDSNGDVSCHYNVPIPRPVLILPESSDQQEPEVQWKAAQESASAEQKNGLQREV